MFRHKQTKQTFELNTIDFSSGILPTEILDIIWRKDHEKSSKKMNEEFKTYYKLKNTKIDNQTDKIKELVGYTNYIFVDHGWEKYPIDNKFFSEPGIVRIDDLLDV